MLCQFQVEAAIKIKTGSPKTALESYVIKDAVSFLSKMYTDAIDTSGSGTTFDIVIGTPNNNSLIADQITGGSLVLPTGKYAGQGYAIKTIGTTIYVAASSDTGLSPGMYDLLQQLGAYFQISGEILPAPSAFAITNISVSVAPAFRYCGLFPWDNFLCGMSGWNEEDFKLFIDRMARLRFNFIEFHNYPGMAYYNETYTDGSPNSTSDHVADYANSFTNTVIGGGAMGTTTTFGTRQWWQNQSKGNAVAQDSCQAMMRRVIDYAHSRGLQTVIGYCLMQPNGGNFAMTNSRGWNAMPDPLNANNINKQVDRYRRLAQIYPKSDYYWLWQAEAGGVLWNNLTNDAAASNLRTTYASWNPGGGRGGDIDYGYEFWQTVNKLTSAERSKIATGGWDMSKMFIGFDKNCPSEIIFHNMNSWDTRGSINQAKNEYKLGASQRRLWMTDWWEYDGIVWFPEYRVRKQDTIYTAAVANNVECMTLDGWKQSGVEHNIKYLSEFNWNPKLTGRQFYTDYCGKVYGSSAVSVMANLYNVNDSLEPTIPAATTGDYRDMNISEGWATLQLSALTTDATTIANCQTLITKQNALIARDQTFSSSLKSLRPSLSATGQYWLDLMINRLDFQVLYVQSLTSINKAYVDYKASGKSAAITDLNMGLDGIYQSILKLSQCARNTSDLGLIGQINILDYNILKQFITSNGGTVAASPAQPMLAKGSAVKEVSIFSLDGKCIARQVLLVKNVKLPQINSGIYLIIIRDATGNVQILKEHITDGKSLVAKIRG